MLNPDAGWVEYPFLSPEIIAFAYVAPNISLDDANKTMNPFVTFVKNATSDNVEFVTEAYESFYAWYLGINAQGTNNQTAASSGSVIYSRFIPRNLVESNPKKVVDAIVGNSGGAAIKYETRPVSFLCSYLTEYGPWQLRCRWCSVKGRS